MLLKYSFNVCRKIVLVKRRGREKRKVFFLTSHCAYAKERASPEPRNSCPQKLHGRHHA
jgi:hypothetical protein